MPHHVKPPKTVATAPYNFVPLPQRVFEVADGIDVGGRKSKPWEVHDQFVDGTYSGSVELTIRTLTPLFIRGPVLQRQDRTWDARESRLRPEPYMAPDGRPLIPGSSLRGMVRTLVEVLSFSKIRPVDDRRPFFRTVDDTRIGRAYRERMRRGSIRGGRLQRVGDEWWIVECDVLRVRRSRLQRNIHEGNQPNWLYQHRPCWVQVRGEEVSDIAFEERTSWRRGTLVLTGDVPRKTYEFVFLEAPPNAARVNVPDRIFEQFHEDGQITRWQQTAFPVNQPPNGGRRAPGHLRDGEPVFFLKNDSNDNRGGLVFLGRAGMFRLPYDLCPAELVPRHLREGGLDIAEAMFGTVDSGGAIKGRVHFEDALAIEGGPPWCNATLVPRVLSAPKPTTFQHYLTQDGTKGPDRLTTYLEGDRTTIRGHKLYWHRDDGSGLSQIREARNHDGLLNDLRGDAPCDTQHTIITPVRTGVTFVGRVRFENLTDIELGALLHALQLPDSCAHRLGMGKPLGLGSIRIEARLSLVDHRARYRAWQATGSVEGEAGTRFRDAFSAAMLEHARQSRETMVDQQEGLRRIARLDALFHLLEWSGRPAPSETAYMNLEDFRGRPVLCTAHAIAKAAEPPWPTDPPRPGESSSTPRAQENQSAPAARSANIPLRSASVPSPKPIQKGQTREGTLKRRGQVWVALFEGDVREGEIVNQQIIGANCAEGARAEFFIVEQSRRVGIKCRLERMRTPG